MKIKIFGIILALTLVVGLGVVTGAPTTPVEANGAMPDRVTVITKAADRLASVQNADGGFPWALPGSGTSYTNILGITAVGILEGWKLDPKSSYETALAKAYKYCVDKPPTYTWDAGKSKYVESTLGVDSFPDITFLIQLAQAADSSSSLLGAIQTQVPSTTPADIATLAKTRWDNRVLYLGSTQQDPPNGTATGLAQYIRDSRHSQNLDALIPWDLEAGVKAALVLDAYYPGQGYAQQALDIAEVIYNSIDDPGNVYFSSTDENQEEYIAGLTGGIEALREVNQHLDKAAELVTKLLAKQQTGGYWDYYGASPVHKSVQSTAYAIMALQDYSAEAVTATWKAAAWLSANQKGDGGWYAEGGSGGEIAEVDSEAAWALATLPAPVIIVESGKGYYCIQPAIDAASAGDTINVAAGTYSENLNITKPLTLTGAGKDLVTLNPATTGYGIGISAGGSNVTIEKMTINAGNATNFLVHVSHVSNFSIKDVKGIGAGKTVQPGGQPLGGIDLNTVTTALIQDVEVQDVSRNGLSLTDSTGVTINNANVHDTGVSSGWAGVAIYANSGTTSATFAGTSTITNTPMGLYVEDMLGTTVNLSLASDITFSGQTIAPLVRLGLGNVSGLEATGPSASFAEALGLVARLTAPNYTTPPYNLGASFFYTVADAVAAAVDPGHYQPNTNVPADVQQYTVVYHLIQDEFYVGPGMKIQAAIDAALPNDTINVLAGTYTEGPQIVINKNLSIVGEDEDTTIIKPSADTGNTGDARGWFLVNDSQTFNLSNITLDGSGHKIYQAIRHKGSGTITSCNFRNILYEPSGPAYNGMAIAVMGTGNVDVTNCTFANIGRIGVIYFGPGVTGSTFSQNIYEGKGEGNWLDYGVEVGGGAHATISNSNISGNLGVASVDGSTSAAILVTTYYGAGTQATITGNTLTDNTEGIAVGYDANDTSTVVAHFNNISGNTLNGISTTAPEVDATLNWWGHSYGPSHDSPVSYGDKVSANVTYQPWLIAEYEGQTPTPGLTITTDSILPSGGVGLPYSQALEASGGSGEYSWANYYGLPVNGLSISADGKISGTPIKAGTYQFEVQVHDEYQGIWKAFQVSISPTALSIVTTSPLPDGEVSVPYTKALEASGGTGPNTYTWSIIRGALPAGLSLAEDGNIAGTPTASGDFSFRVQVVDETPQRATRDFALKIWPELQMVPTSLPDGDVSVPYSENLVATGGTGTYTWSISAGSLPPGLTLNPSTGEISGTPTAAGEYDFTAQVDDGIGTATQNLSIKVWASPLSVATTSLPDGEVSVAYSATLVATGGTGTYTWSISTGALPPGLTLNPSTGEISGTPTAAGTYNFTARVQSGLQIAQKALSIKVWPQLQVATTSLCDGEVGVAYSETLAATGGTGSYTWSITAGALPPGLTLNPSTGEISGTPTTAGTYNFTAQVTDGLGTDTQNLSIKVWPQLQITTTSLPDGQATVPYSAMLAADGGTSTYTWSISAGALPPGLDLNPSTGEISGTPAAAGTYNFTAQVDDGIGMDTQNLSIKILPIITVTSPNGGEEWVAGTTQTITWTSVGVTGNVRIQLSRDGGSTWTTIIASTPNDGNQTWKVTGPPTTQAKIKVVSIATPAVFDTSDDDFKIIQSITVTSPNGGEEWVAGTTQTITWTSVGVTGNVRIQLSRDGGSTWTTIIASTPNDGNQTWKVTGPPTTQAKIKVVSITTPAVFDTSDDDFKITNP